METHEVKELLSQFDQSTLTELQLKKRHLNFILIKIRQVGYKVHPLHLHLLLQRMLRQLLLHQRLLSQQHRTQ